MNAAETVTVPSTPEAPSFAALAGAFARGAAPCHYGHARFDGRRFYSYEARVAERVSSTEVWITTGPVSAVGGKHVAALRRAAISYGLSIVGGPKPPADHSSFAPIPALYRQDALVVVRALAALAGSSKDPEEADRARRLAAIYTAASNGDSPLAAALYLALPPLTPEK